MVLEKIALITGAAGFLGGHVAHNLARAGWTVIGVDRNLPNITNGVEGTAYDHYFRTDLSSIERLKELLSQVPVSHCVHLAGPADVQFSIEHPRMDFEAQLLPFQNLLDAVRIVRPSVRTLLVSSAAVYGNPSKLPVSESDQLAPISPYGYHKMMQELVCEEYQRCYGLPVAVARVFSVYGPGQIKLAIWEIAKRALDGNYSVFGTGRETRDYLYVEDVAHSLRVILEKGEFTGEAYNIASGVETSMQTVADLVYDYLGVDQKPKFDIQNEKGKPDCWQADVTKLQRLSVHTPTTLQQGLEKTISWIKQQV